MDERDPISDSKIKFDDVGEDDEDDDDLDSEELDELNYEGPIHRLISSKVCTLERVTE